MRAALVTSKTAARQDAGTWRVEGGRDEDGDDLTVIVLLEEDGDLVITVF